MIWGGGGLVPQDAGLRGEGGLPDKGGGASRRSRVGFAGGGKRARLTHPR